MKQLKRTAALVLLALTCLLLSGCNANVGVGLNVGIPIGDHGYMNVGTGRWY